MVDNYFLVQVKRTKEVIEKGVVVKDTFDAAKQSFHAYLGAYAFDHDPDTDYVMVEILDSKGLGLKGEFWEKEVIVPEVPVEEE